MWLQISGETQLLLDLIRFIIYLIAMTITFYIAGVIVVGKRRALLSDAFVISLLGTVVEIICTIVKLSWVGVIFSFIIWLLLIRRYYETGWLGAFAVAILAALIMAIIGIILEQIGGFPPTLSLFTQSADRLMITFVK